jgi:hypothetical protein
MTVQNVWLVTGAGRDRRHKAKIPKGPTGMEDAP